MLDWQKGANCRMEVMETSRSVCQQHQNIEDKKEKNKTMEDGQEKIQIFGLVVKASWKS